MGMGFHVKFELQVLLVQGKGHSSANTANMQLSGQITYIGLKVEPVMLKYALTCHIISFPSQPPSLPQF